MKSNTLTIQISKPVEDVFLFTITPPNSTRWITSINKETTNEWPIRRGTKYQLYNNQGEKFEVIVADIQENELVEWVSKDHNYHCKYTYQVISKNVSKLTYHEWVDNGEIDGALYPRCIRETEASFGKFLLTCITR